MWIIYKYGAISEYLETNIGHGTLHRLLYEKAHSRITRGFMRVIEKQVKKEETVIADRYKCIFNKYNLVYKN